MVFKWSIKAHLYGEPPDIFGACTAPGVSKCESRGMEGTDVIRRTSSTFSLQEVGSESAILGDDI